MAHRTPNEGGCWFCQDDEGEMYFSLEFDTYFHPECMKKELGKNPEADIIAEEFRNSGVEL